MTFFQKELWTSNAEPNIHFSLAFICYYSGLSGSDMCKSEILIHVSNPYPSPHSILLGKLNMWLRLIYAGQLCEIKSKQFFFLFYPDNKVWLFAVFRSQIALNSSLIHPMLYSKAHLILDKDMLAVYQLNLILSGFLLQSHIHFF